MFYLIIIENIFKHIIKPNIYTVSSVTLMFYVQLTYLNSNNQWISYYDIHLTNDI